MKNIFLLFLLMLSVGALFGQPTTNYQSISTPYKYRHGLFDSVLGMPYGPVPVLRQVGGHSRPGALFFNTTDSTIYIWTGTQFIKAGSSGSGSGLSGGNAGSGWRWYDPSSQSIRTFRPDVGLLFDTLTAGELRAAVDTLIIGTRAWNQKGLDSVGNLIASLPKLSNAGSAWRWFDPSTNALRTFRPDVGLLFDTLTSGELRAAVDTSIMATRAWRQKAVDSLMAQIIANRFRFGLDDTTTSIGRVYRGNGTIFRMDSLILHLNGNAFTGISFFTGSLANSDYWIARVGSALTLNSPGSLALRSNGNLIYNFNAADGHIYRNSSGTEMLRLNANGSLLMGTSTNDGSAILNLSSTSKGVLIPRMSTTNRDAISSPATGLLIYNTSTNKFNFYSGSAWTEIGTGSGSGTNNSNAGSGFRLLKPAGQEIKTLFAGPGIAIDSTSNSDGVTISSTGPNYTVQTLTDGSTITWDVSAGVNAQVTLAGTGRTLSITNPTAGHYYTIRIIQDGTGSRTISSWPTNTKWPGGIGPTLSTAASKYDIVTFYYDGTNYYATYQLDFQ